MALSKSSYGSVGVCRLYVDYMQYCKSIGYINNYQNMNIDGDDKAAWDYNPANMQTYQVNITSEADNALSPPIVLLVFVLYAESF